ncbi:hypothetical protein [Reichenbachiella sp. MALMAid0571]|uniref:hypothetical protein n=1 Tax=Reichenbachiella sp. MALMAid0571 TaxID=3143939 RepID=UPI0032DEF409
MTKYELVAITIAIFSGLGTFIAWMINQERLNKIEKQTAITNQIALQANELSHTANLVSKQGFQAEVNKFKSQKLEKIVKELDQHVKDYKKYNVITSERRDSMLRGLMLYLIDLNKYKVGLFENHEVTDIINNLIKNVHDFFNKSMEYEIANEDFKQITGANNLTVLLGINKDPKMQATAERRSISYNKLKDISKLIDNQSKVLLSSITTELHSALLHASKPH